MEPDTPETLATLAAALRAEMDHQGLRIRTLAARMGAPNGARNVVRRVLTGQSVHLSSLLRIAEALGLEVEVHLVAPRPPDRATMQEPPATAGPA